MKWKVQVILVLSLIFCFSLLGGIAYAGFIDFENGSDGQPVSSTIPGLEFTNTAGYDWLYGDWRSGNYNGPYPNGSYYSYGNFFAWLGTDQGTGRITFIDSFATYFEIYYSGESTVYLEAYDEADTLLDFDSGNSNLDTGQMNSLRVEAYGIKYVVLHDTGNYWLVDNVSTDAVNLCNGDADCDDGVFCNGEEKCVDFLCESGQAVDCGDDGLWCNGYEYCDSKTDSCMTSKFPCNETNQTCNEDKDECVDLSDDDDDINDDDDDTDGDDDDDDDSGNPKIGAVGTNEEKSSICGC